MRLRDLRWMQPFLPSTGCVSRQAVARCATMLFVALAACSHAPTDTTRAAGRAQLAFSTSVSAAPGAVVEAVVSFTPAGGSAVELGRDSIIVNTGGADASLSLTADISPCVRAATAGSACVLDLVVRLKRDGVVLDESTQRLTVAGDAERIDAAPVQLTEVASIRTTPTAITGLEPGDSLALFAVAIARSGAVVAARLGTWSVVSGGVTIDANNFLRAVSPGAAVIRATLGGRTQDLAFTVGQPTVATLTVLPADTTLRIGANFQYRVVARSAAGAVLTGKTITFSSSAAASIATITSGGLITVVGAGTSVITATTTDGRAGATVTGRTNVTFEAAPRLQVAPSNVTFTATIGSPLPPSQTVAVTGTGPTPYGNLTLTPMSDSLVVATLDRTTVPATITLRVTSGVGAGLQSVREFDVVSSLPGVASARVSVTIVGAATGRLSGLVVNAATRAPIVNAIVTVRRASDSQPVDVLATNANGVFTSLPQQGGTYNLTVTAPGYVDVSVSQVALTAGPTVPVTTVATILMTPVSTTGGRITGDVRDATTNLIIAGATVELRSGINNVTGTVISTVTTTANGTYAFTIQPSGSYTIRTIKTGFVDGSTQVTVSAADIAAPTVFMSPSTGTVAWRFVLSWGATPLDLDAHLTGPIPSSSARFHVWYSDVGSATASPFAVLDIDETEGFGPETITMSQQFDGTYRYYVNQFSSDGSLKASNARVDVYKGNTLMQRFSPPQQDGTYWTVFEITNGVLVPINTIGSVTPSISAPTSGPVRSKSSPAADARAEWWSLAPWHWPTLKKSR